VAFRFVGPFWNPEGFRWALIYRSRRMATQELDGDRDAEDGEAEEEESDEEEV
jgi:hypothetical protein